LAQADALVRLSFHDQRGNIIPFDTFRTVIHHDFDDRYEALYYNVFTMHQYSTIDIYVYDIFNQLVMSVENVSYSPYLDYEITVYSYKIHNHQEDFIHVNLTKQGTGYYWSEWLAPWETAEYLLQSGTYDLKVTYTNSTYAEYTGIPVSTDYYFLVEGDTLHDVMNNIYMVDAHLDSVNQSISDQIYSVNITIGNVNSSISNQIVTVNLNLDNVNTTIHTQITDLQTLVENVNGSIITNINNLGTNITNQFVELYVNLTQMNSTIANQFASLFLNISNINSTMGTQYLDIIAHVNALNSTMTSQFVNVLTEIYNTNQAVFQSKLDLLSKINWADANALQRAQQILLGQEETKNQISILQIISIVATVGSAIVAVFTIYKKIVKPYAPKVKKALEEVSIKELIKRRKAPELLVKEKRKRAEERRRRA